MGQVILKIFERWSYLRLWFQNTVIELSKTLPINSVPLNIKTLSSKPSNNTFKTYFETIFRIYCTWRAKTSCQIMFTCHSKLTRTKTICELFMTCHPNMTNVLIAFVFLFTGKQKSGCRQLQVFNHRWHCCMFAYKSYFMLIWCNLV